MYIYLHIFIGEGAQHIPSQPTSQEKLLLSVGSGGQQILETVSALQVRQEKEQEIIANDIYWGTKLRELEARVSVFLSVDRVKVLCLVSRLCHDIS